MHGSRSITLAATGSALIHLLLVLLVAVQIVLAPDWDHLVPRPPGAQPDEVTIAMPELLKPPPQLPEELDPLEPATDSAEAKARRSYIQTTHNDPEEAAPATAQFESDRNTTAASQTQTTSPTDSPLPNQDGLEDVPFVGFIDRQYVDGVLADDDTRGDFGPESPSTPAPAAVASPQPVATNQGKPTDSDGDSPDAPADGGDGESTVAKTAPPPSVEETRDLPGDGEPLTLEDAMLPELPEDPVPDLAQDPGELSLEEVASLMRGQNTPLPETMPDSRPSPARPTPGSPETPDENAYQPHNRRTHYEGGIGRTGESAVDAADTPLGRYGKTVTQIIGRKWHRYRLDKGEFLDYATIKLEFQIDAAGNVQNLRIASNNANAIMTDFTLSAVLDAELPAIPPDVLALLDNGRFNITYSVIVY